MERRGQINPEAVEMEFAHQRGGTADEHLADHLLPKAGRKAAGTVVEVSAVGPYVIGRPTFVPVVDIALRGIGVVGPLRSFGVEGVMVVDDVEEDGDAAL